ncbi:hypothetical protein DI272_10000 [Streptomyces sp. Act143]|nr:hypothetical protein DI272_10000 [Streptomyces sp. Act143]
MQPSHGDAAPAGGHDAVVLAHRGSVTSCRRHRLPAPPPGWVTVPGGWCPRLRCRRRPEYPEGYKCQRSARPQCSPRTNATAVVPAVFVIHPGQIVRAVLSCLRNAGRIIPEIERLLDALQTSDRDGVACPANRNPGEDVVLGAPRTRAELEARLADDSVKLADWYMAAKPAATSWRAAGVIVVRRGQVRRGPCSCCPRRRTPAA